MSRVQPLSALLQMLTAPVIWFAHFVVLYGTEALVCTPSLANPGAMTWITIVATLAALGALGAFAVHLMRNPARTVPADGAATLLHVASLLLALLSALAVIWVALPTMILPVCAPPTG